MSPLSRMLATLALAAGGAVFGTGCATPPAAPPGAALLGPEWVVEDLDKAGIVDRSRITLHFGIDGRVAGLASCNQYGGSYRVEQGRLVVSHVVATLRACPPALMAQERRFLDLLDTPLRIERTPDGALVLRGDGHQGLTARRP
ncbi:META domain-containing protein [Aquincola sp. MAHUQ-54]|uniref:META domain-containing protein n=1 Tax=Aquincola agrisoli TaxID=3119538 RepID=A0AAW9QEQ0_9BURK